MACPDQTCGAEMRPERPGRLWRCTCDHRHVFQVISPASRGRAAHRRLQTAAEHTGAKREPEPWPEMERIGIKTRLLPPPQGTAGPGDYCQPLGDIAGGGGAKSGRKKRKKPKPRPPLDPWGA